MLENSNVLPQIEGNHDCMLWICKIIIFQVKMVYLCKQPVWIFGRVHSQNQEHPEGTCLRRRQESQHCLKARFFYKSDGLTWLRSNVTIIYIIGGSPRLVSSHFWWQQQQQKRRTTFIWGNIKHIFNGKSKLIWFASVVKMQRQLWF